MGSSIFFGGSLIAAVIAGAIALFAPCCISVMLPAYFASSFQNRRVLVAMTFLFAAGIASVILPLAMGASILRQLFSTQHILIYMAGSVFLLGLAAYILLGGQIHLPMPGRRTGGKKGPLSVYLLGVFSGVASSCCAPVLAGVIALSSVASSFLLALGLGLGYVFGMVAPLFFISLLWERFEWRKSVLFRPKVFTYRIGLLKRTISATNLASGLLLALMGGLTLWIGLTGTTMPASTDWQGQVGAALQNFGQLLTQALSWIPGWVVVLVIVGLVVLLVRRALRQTGYGKADSEREKVRGIKIKEEVNKGNEEVEVREAVLGPQQQ